MQPTGAVIAPQLPKVHGTANVLRYLVQALVGWVHADDMVTRLQQRPAINSSTEIFKPLSQNPKPYLQLCRPVNMVVLRETSKAFCILALGSDQSLYSLSNILSNCKLTCSILVPGKIIKQWDICPVVSCAEIGTLHPTWLRSGWLLGGP